LGRVSSSDLDLLFAVIVAAGALASAVALLVAIVGMRLGRSLRERRLARRVHLWRGALHEAIDDPGAASLPALSRLDLPDFLSLFNHLQESLRGEAADNIASLLRRHGVNQHALDLLDSHSLRLRLIAITALGHLGEERAWDRLEAFAHERQATLSFAAVRALLRIEPRRALETLASDMVTREDWSIARIGGILHELGPAAVTAPLLRLLQAPPATGHERLVKLARFAHRERIAEAMKAWLSTHPDPHVIAAALDYVENADHLPWVRGAARHAHWHVRMAAARALARIGGTRELAALLELLRDPAWWVRYHAAQALSQLHGLSAAELADLRERARDAFASDMLDHVLAERGLG
jgi:HEAT repeat protein